MKEALAGLTAAGMESAEVSTFDSLVSNGFLETLGFGIVRRFCRMRRSLTDAPSGAVQPTFSQQEKQAPRRSGAL